MSSKAPEIWVPNDTRIRRPVGGLHRRKFLGGAAAMIGLPFLESLAPKSAKAQAAAGVRLAYIFMPNGLDMATFRPTATGASYPMPPMLASLEPYRANFSVVTGLANYPGLPDGNGDHASGTAAAITAAKANKSETSIRLGVSADQIAAKAFGNLTRLPSLQLGTDGGVSSGNCDNGYSCAYARNISWADATTPLPKLTDPKQVFDTIFRGYDPDATDAEQAARRELETSILDVVLDDAEALSPKLGATDRVKLDQYLEGIRELERRVTTAAPPEATCTMGQAPTLSGSIRLDEHVRVLTDLLVTAWQCDATRIVSFMYGNASSKKTFPWLNINDAHHDISHHAGDRNRIAQLAAIGKWQMETIAYLFGRLAEIPDGPNGESMLHNSAIYIGSDVSDGDAHNHDDMPVILGGHAAGALNPGSHIAYASGQNAEREKVSNLLVTMLAAAGVQGSLGDSDGALLAEL
jgi:hypothetical protein